MLLTTSNETLVLGSADVSDDMVEAFDYTLAWAQRAARRKNPDAASKGYFDAMLNGLERTGWQVRHSEFGVHEIGDREFTGFGIVEATLYPYLGDRQHGELSRLFGADGQAEGSDLNKILRGWWGLTQVKAELTAMAIGALYEHDDKPTVKLGHYSLHFGGDDWHSLFEERSSPGGRVETYFLTIALDMRLWRHERDRIKRDVQEEAKSRITSTAVDL